MDIQQVADMLGRSTRTVHRMVKNGTLNPTRKYSVVPTSMQVLDFDESEVQKILAERK